MAVKARKKSASKKSAKSRVGAGGSARSTKASGKGRKTARKSAAKPAKKRSAKTARKRPAKVVKKQAKKTTARRKTAAKPASKRAKKAPAKKKVVRKPVKKKAKKAPAKPKKKSAPKAAPKKKSAAKPSTRTVKKAPVRKAVNNAAATTALSGVAAAGTSRRKARSGRKPATDTWAQPLGPQVDNPPLKRSEINRLKRTLQAERERLLREVQDLERLSISDSSQDGRNEREGYSIHMAETASDYQMVELTLLQNTVETQLLQMIEESLMKIQGKTYGTCERCSANIGFERLKAKPFARLCIVCRSAIERGQV
jgi:RNA polymerase-binding protein DksA